MRIVYLNHNVVWRSTFYRCLAYGRELVRRGHEVAILTIHPTAWRGFASREVDGVEVVETPDLTRGMARSGWDPWNTLRRIGYLRRRSFDLVHAFDARPAVILPALWLRRRLGIPLVLDWADWWGRGGIIAERRSWWLRTAFAPVETWFEERFRARADALTVIGAALAERAAGLGVPRERIHRLPGGVDPERWAPREPGPERARLALPADAPLVLFSGFVHYDIDLVLGSFARLLRDEPRARLVLTGRASGDVSRRVSELGLEGAVIDRGTVPPDDVPAYVAAADVCLVPFADKQANRGRWPNKLGDYLAMGKAVVSNPVGEVAALLGETGAGVLAEPAPEAMARAIAGLLGDPDARLALGKRARLVAETRLAYRHLVRPLERLYLELAGAAGGGGGAAGSEPGGRP